MLEISRSSQRRSRNPKEPRNFKKVKNLHSGKSAFLSVKQVKLIPAIEGVQPARIKMKLWGNTNFKPMVDLSILHQALRGHNVLSANTWKGDLEPNHLIMQEGKVVNIRWLREDTIEHHRWTLHLANILGHPEYEF